jgi:hypothetical protein
MGSGEKPTGLGSATLPLCVDLDGTLIKTDLLWEYFALLGRLFFRPAIPGRILPRKPFGAAKQGTATRVCAGGSIRHARLDAQQV